MKQMIAPRAGAQPSERHSPALESSSALMAHWQAESPFPDDYARTVEPERPAASPSVTRAQSPFLAELEFPGQLGAADAEREALAEFLADIHDQELDDAVSELMDEAWEVSGVRALGEYGDEAARDARVQRRLSEHFTPLIRHGQELLERMGHELSALDPLSLGEAELNDAHG